MYRELEFEEGKEIVLRLTTTYTCMKEEAPMYTPERLDKLNAYNFDLVIVHVELEKTEGVIGFIDNIFDKDELFIWVDNTIGIVTEEDLKIVIHQTFQIFTEYAKKRGCKFLSTRVVKWKDFKPTYRRLFDNWREIIEPIGQEYFVDFEVVDEEVMRFVVK